MAEHQEESFDEPRQEAGQRPPSEREGGIMTTSSEEMVDVMEEAQGSTTTLGELTSERDIGAGDRGMEEQPETKETR